jgi:carbon storage regulator
VTPDRIRIGIEAPASVGVHREELYLEIQQANVEAAASASTVTDSKSPTDASSPHDSWRG